MFACNLNFPLKTAFFKGYSLLDVISSRFSEQNRTQFDGNKYQSTMRHTKVYENEKYIVDRSTMKISNDFTVLGSIARSTYVVTSDLKPF